MPPASLRGPEKEAFEQQLQTDTSLQTDVAMQKQIIQGIRQARAIELKTLLNQIPVGGLMQSGAFTAQIAAGVIAASVVITGTLLYFKPWQKETVAPVIPKEIPAAEKEKNIDTAVVDLKEEKTSPPISETNKETVRKPSPVKAQKAIQPKIEVVDPTDELSSETTREKGKTDKAQPTVIASRIAVETITTNSEYTFHYQFNQGKLILYGAFDKGLYEILEVNGDRHSVFLYYKENYYLLNERQTLITPLTSIRDPQVNSEAKRI